jgi:hypothetical protein
VNRRGSTHNLMTIVAAITFVIAARVESRAQSPVRAEAPAQPAAEAPPEPPLRRWFEIQNFTVYTRYRFIENSKDVTTSNQLQYKDSFRARFNIDAARRFTVNFGYFSGNSFTSTWDNWGVGNDTAFDGKNNYMKQLYAAAIPIAGLEVQGGGLYVSRGEGDEFLTYDDDGYLVGGRVSVRRPRQMYLDEITVTRASIGPLNTPALSERWKDLEHLNYTQLLGVKRFNHIAAGSLSYERQVGADIMRAAVTLRFSKAAPVSNLRFEQYRRFNLHPAAGFALWAERPITRHFRLQGGYVTVDQFYGGWNADRMLSGRRFFAIGTIPIYGPVNASIYATRALSAPYAVPIARRFDAVISYDVLDSLRRTHIF